jgi:SAM-dependent methyltransferase
MQPPCQSVIREEQLTSVEHFYPLHAFVCHNCFLVQLEEYVSPVDIFTEYAYFSSYSDSWLDHSRRYVDMISEKLDLNSQSLVIEIASNDGYLLQYFMEKNVPILGIEPAANVAQVATARGIPTLVQFFNSETAKSLLDDGKTADLIIGNNVLAQVPPLNDFVKGVTIVLKENGVATFEFPHLVKLMADNQFDTIYHEHFSYFSFSTIDKIFEKQGLRLFDVEEIPTHGGSLRIYVKHAEDRSKKPSNRVDDLLQREREFGILCIDTYHDFENKVKSTKRKALSLLIKLKNEGKTIVGYGAPGKGNTFLNYTGIRTDFLDYVVDRNPYKQGTYLPGTHIPIYDPHHIKETKPNYVVILPWNLKNEILKQNEFIKEWGGKFITMIPEPMIIDD